VSQIFTPRQHVLIHGEEVEEKRASFAVSFGSGSVHFERRQFKLQEADLACHA